MTHRAPRVGRASRAKARRLRAGVAVAFCAAALAVAAGAERSGVVFDDVDGDGLRDPQEPGVEGVVVSAGATLVRTDAQGRYRLPDARADAPFVVVTCPAARVCARWFRRDAGDFGLRRRPAGGAGDEFLFVQMSDAHVFDRAADFARYSLPSVVRRVPQRLAGFVALRMFDRMTPDRDREQIASALRAELGRTRREGEPDPDSLSDSQVVGALLGRLLEEQGGTIDPAGDFEAALSEIAALGPRFVVSTGDMVLESNEGDAQAIDRWMRFYREAVARSGLRVYDTIGNNEIAGSGNDDFEPGDPGYGKASFRSHFGPTHYSFDRGPYHFVALDTHRMRRGETWDFDAMERDVRAWFEADLAAHRDRPTVVLNHEPFRYDARWTIPRSSASIADDEGLLAKYGVDATLSGHVHMNGLVVEGEAGSERTFITTGSLSGLRWILPADASPRGYRLLYSHEGRLYSAWKETGRPALGFVSPPGDAGLYPTGPSPSPARTARDVRRIVAVAVDAAGPFETLSLSLDGEVLPLEHWGRFFVSARVDASRLGSGAHRLWLRARGADGTVHERALEVAPQR